MPPQTRRIIVDEPSFNEPQGDEAHTVCASPDEAPVLFFHIPKCGGTSVIGAVRSRLGYDEAIGVYDTRPDRLVGRLRQLAARPQTRLLHGHFPPAAVPADVPVRRAVLLRDPLDRLLSHFCFAFQRQLTDEEQFRFFSQPAYLGRTSFGHSDLVEWIEHHAADNLITRYLIGKLTGHIDRHDAEGAIAVLRGMNFVGLNENLDEFLVRIGRATTGAPLDPIWLNPSDRSVLVLSDRFRADLRRTYAEYDDLVVQAARPIIDGQAARASQVRLAPARHGKPRYDPWARLRQRTPFDLALAARQPFGTLDRALRRALQLVLLRLQPRRTDGDRRHQAVSGADRS